MKNYYLASKSQVKGGGPMLRSGVWRLNKPNESNLDNIKLKYNEDLVIERCRLNLYRIRIITAILIVINLALIYVDISRFSRL